MTENSPIEVEAVILAAGASKRMGCNKLLLPFHDSLGDTTGDKTVLDCVLASYTQAGFAAVHLVTSDPETAKIASRYRVTLCHNALSSLGKSSSIHIGVQNCTPGNGILFGVADQPLLTTQTITELLLVFRDNPEKIVVPKIRGNFANPVIFPGKFRSALLALQGDLGGKEIIRLHPDVVQTVPFECEDEFQDIDTPEAFAKLLVRLQGVKYP